MLHSREDEISLVISFLVTYGFLEEFGPDRLKTPTWSPTPSEAVRLLKIISSANVVVS